MFTVESCIICVLLLMACVESFQMAPMLRLSRSKGLVDRKQEQILARRINNVFHPHPKSLFQLTESIDNIVEEVAVVSPTESRNVKFENIIHSLIATSPPLTVKKLIWSRNKLEINLVNTVNETESSPSMDELGVFHKALYTMLEADPALDLELANLELDICSPGLGDVLQNDKDFATFKGFDVLIHTSEAFNKKIQTLGRLVERTAEHVIIHQKGRKVKIPRDIITLVKMPPSLFEA